MVTRPIVGRGERSPVMGIDTGTRAAAEWGLRPRRIVRVDAMPYDIGLGDWGSDLDDVAYGRALAALGVALGDVDSLPGALAAAANARYLERRFDEQPVPHRLPRNLTA